MSAAVPWFPVVGLLLGLAQGGLYVGLGEIMTPVLAAVLATAAAALVTGAFHHDGLADMADSFGGGWTREQRLEILKDSRLGTYGVTALIFVIFAEVAAVSSLAGWTAIAATAAAHAVSRAVAITTMVLAKPAGDSGLGVDYLRGLSRPAVFGVGAVVLVAALVVFGAIGLAVVVTAGAMGAAVVRLAHGKIGGISGDVLGAVQQLAKIAVLVTVVVAADSLDDAGDLEQPRRSPPVRGQPVRGEPVRGQGYSSSCHRNQDAKAARAPHTSVRIQFVVISRLI